MTTWTTRKTLAAAGAAALAAGALAAGAPALSAAPSKTRLADKSVDGAELFLRYTAEGGKPAKYTNLLLTVTFETFDPSISKLPLKGIAATSYGRVPKLTLKNVNGDEGRDAIVDVRGAGLETISSIVLSKSMTNWQTKPFTVNWGRTGYKLKDLDHDGSSEFVTGDERFDEVVPGDAIFTYPLVIKRGAKTKLVDVTAKFPDQIKAQIAEVRKQVDAGTASETTLATLIADLSRLGDTAGAKAVVDAAFEHNELNTKLAKELGQQLKTWGYVADPAAIGLGG